jgi:hypothetical protein
LKRSAHLVSSDSDSSEYQKEDKTQDQDWVQRPSDLPNEKKELEIIRIPDEPYVPIVFPDSVEYAELSFTAEMQPKANVPEGSELITGAFVRANIQGKFLNCTVMQEETFLRNGSDKDTMLQLA